MLGRGVSVFGGAKSREITGSLTFSANLDLVPGSMPVNLSKKYVFLG